MELKQRFWYIHGKSYIHWFPLYLKREAFHFIAKARAARFAFSLQLR
jgi:hypothetical protein